MHFVRKVATTEEQKEKKRKENEVKLRKYLVGRERIFEKRRKGELDGEMLALTATMLEKNPDIYTFWNIRRDIVENELKKFCDLDDPEQTSKMNDLLGNELQLTEACLKSNCKSYGVWFHRFWTFKRLKNPDVVGELKKCENLMDLDARNFHCWDHRYAIVNFYKQPSDEELRLTERLISKNFSNYSAWHYRACLLSKLWPDDKHELILNHETLDREAALLKNAYFTDPEDQSAWMYSLWLFLTIPESEEPKVLSLNFDYPKDISNECEPSSATIVFSKGIESSKIADYLSIQLKKGETVLDTRKLPLRPKNQFRSIYQLRIDEELSNCEVRSTVGKEFEKIAAKIGYIDFDELFHIYHIKRKDMNVNRRRLIENFATDCLALYNELLREDKKEHLKWPLFCYIMAMLELDPVGNQETVQKDLKKLAVEIDPKRAQMYGDMSMNLDINSVLRHNYKHRTKIDSSPEICAGIDFLGKLDLTGIQLRSVEHLRHLAGLVEVLNLSDNKISSLKQFNSFQRLRSLYLDGNPIKSVKYVSAMNMLSTLSVSGTLVAKAEDLAELVHSNVQTLAISSTELASSEVELSKLRTMMPQLHII